MTEKELKEFIEENAPQFKKAVADRMINQLAETYRWQMPDVMDKIVKDFMDVKVVPLVKEHLTQNKGAIVEACLSSIAKIGDEVSKLLLKQALENLQGYRGGEVIKKMFGAS